HAGFSIEDLCPRLAVAPRTKTPLAQKAAEYKNQRERLDLPRPFAGSTRRQTTGQDRNPAGQHTHAFIIPRPMASVASSAANPSGTHLQVPGASSSAPVRPKFNSHLTSDRLREGAGLYLPPLFQNPRSNLRKDRVSVFKELGLDDLTAPQGSSSP
ncbi:hypothetical protein E4U42_000808, partial [Claviceps africana]